MTACKKLTKILFPEKWKGAILSSGQVDEFLGNRIKTKNLMTKSKLSQKYWTQDKLQHLIKTKGKPVKENWNLQEGCKNLLIWENNRSLISSPDAIMCFDIGVIEKTRTNKASSICINNDLMWVDPLKRRKNLGHHLAAHFICYLLECNVNLHLLSPNGLEVTYNADFDSEGGERLSNHISNYLEYMKDTWVNNRYNSGWPIKSIEIAADY